MPSEPRRAPGTAPRADGTPGRTTSTVTANQTLAAEARTRGAHVPADGIERRAYGCVAVALSTTGTIASARRVLGLIQPADIRTRAREILGEMIEEDG